MKFLFSDAGLEKASVKFVYEVPGGNAGFESMIPSVPKNEKTQKKEFIATAKDAAAAVERINLAKKNEYAEASDHNKAIEYLFRLQDADGTTGIDTKITKVQEPAFTKPPAANNYLASIYTGAKNYLSNLFSRDDRLNAGVLTAQKAADDLGLGTKYSSIDVS